MGEASGFIIQLSTFGRDNVRVGDLYNYFTDELFPAPNPDQVKIESISKTETMRTFLFQEPEKFQLLMLGINFSHLEFSNVERGTINFNRFWFADYLKQNTTNSNTAQVCVFFRVIKRTERVDERSRVILSNQCQLTGDGKATHLIGQVIYGAEFMCVMERPVDLQLEETKISAEENIYWAAKSYFEQMDGLDFSYVPKVPTELDKNRITCTFYSSNCKLLETETVRMKICSFEEFSQVLRETISNSDSSFEKPIKIALYFVPAQVDARIYRERKLHFELERERHQFLIKKILQNSKSISKHNIVNRVPPLEKTTCQFIDLLRKLMAKINQFYIENTYEKLRDTKELIFFSNILGKILDWLIYLRKEIEKTHSLLKETELVMLDYQEIESRFTPGTELAKVFIIKIDYTPDPLMEEVQKTFGELNPCFKFPKFHIFTQEEEYMTQVKNQLNDFSKEALLNKDKAIWHCIGLKPVSSSLDEGFIQTIKNSNQGLNHSSSLESLLTNYTSSNVTLNPYNDINTSASIGVESKLPQNNEILRNDNITGEDASQISVTSTKKFDHISSDESDDHESNFCQLPSDASPSSNSNTSTNLSENQSLEKTIDKMREQRKSINTESKYDPEMELNERFKKLTIAERIKKKSVGNNETSLKKAENSQETQLQSDSINQQADVEEMKEENETIEIDRKSASSKKVEEYDGELSQPIKPKYPLNKRIAEIFKEEMYSKLIKGDQPNIYLLNAEENVVGNDLRWFDIGLEKNDTLQSSGIQNHKVIILMGATGCGKSTLINGMVNYILGVQWNDSFRFKVIRDDELAERNQAHSQTSSVTAYTLHHHSGMAVPYSITIIDTPGYGDTRGVQRDKEITQIIHRFLTRPETQNDQIHAVCFVAASGDSRLTQTQRYIIDSVLSTFGSDIKDNIRLLVTFADNADPPVVEACLGANFPVTSQSVGITYNKFNSSVLYTSNEKQGEDDFSIDELFWDMGQENFEKFFKMLAEMNGCDLTSTREVIQRRQQAEQTFKEIEEQLEVYLLKIENIQVFTRKLYEYGHNMDANKNYAVETKKIRPIKMNCKKGWVAYNCHQCQKTCEEPVKLTSSDKGKKIKRGCTDNSCKCKADDHEYQYFQWCQTVMTVKKTLTDMKTEYEKKFNKKMSTTELLAQCYEDLNMAKLKVRSLLDILEKNSRSLDSKALRTNALSSADYLSLMRSRVAEEQKPGYDIRLDTLSELQRSLTAHESSSSMGNNYVENSDNSSKIGGTSNLNTLESHRAPRPQPSMNPGLEHYHQTENERIFSSNPSSRTYADHNQSHLNCDIS